MKLHMFIVYTATIFASLMPPACSFGQSKNGRPVLENMNAVTGEVPAAWQDKLQGMGLKNCVHTLSMQTYCFHSKLGAKDTTFLRLHDFTFNKQGNITEYRCDIGKKINKYDKNGNIIETDSEDEYADSGHKLEKTFYKYVYSGNTIEQKFNISGIDDNNNFYNHYSIFYNEKGKKIKEMEYNDGKKAGNKIIYTYDNNGNKTEEDYYDPDGPYKWVSMIYDSIHNKIGERQVIKGRSGGRDTISHIYTYNNSRQLVSDTLYRGCWCCMVERNITDVRNMECDINGNVIKEIHKIYFGKKESTQTILNEYEYDQFGNWTKQTRYSEDGDKKIYIETLDRKISYYE